MAQRCAPARATWRVPNALDVPPPGRAPLGLGRYGGPWVDWVAAMRSRQLMALTVLGRVHTHGDQPVGRRQLPIVRRLTASSHQCAQTGLRRAAVAELRLYP